MLDITHIMRDYMSMFNPQCLPETQSVLSMLHEAVCEITRALRESKSKVIKHDNPSLVFQ